MALQYDKLDLDSEDIRLLRFLPETLEHCSDQQMISCEMRKASLLEKTTASDATRPRLEWINTNIGAKEEDPAHWRYVWGDYVALSYTWGDPTQTKQILINQNPVTVRANLEAALRALLHKPAVQLGLWLWVDALCINQDDLDEREREVPRMRTIYKSARDVVIWLGEEKDNSDMAMRLIKALAGSCEDESAFSLGQKLRKNPSLFGEGSWRALGQLMNRPYWGRVWIMQEIAMGSAESPLLCGQESATWDEFYRALFTFTTHNVDLVFTLVENEYNDTELAGTTYSGLNRNRIIHFNTAQKLQAQPAHGSEAYHNLMPLLDLGRQAFATNDRDKVYGILGLTPDAVQEMVKVDYRLPIAAVYTSFSMAMIQTMQNLAILEQCSGPAPGMPSWAQDWTHKGHWRLFSGVCNYHAGPDLDNIRETSKIDFSEDGKVLRCQMVLIDIIEGAGVSYEYPFRAGHSKAPECNLIQPRTCINPYQTESGLRDALWRTLVGNRTPQGNAAPESYSSLLECALHLSNNSSPIVRSWRGRKAFDQVVEQNACLKIAGRPLSSFFPSEQDYLALADPEASHDAMERMFRLHRSRRLAITSSGYLGLVPVAARPGDSVGILEGCPVPMTLRQLSNDEFEVIGSSYVHGFMEKGDSWKRNLGRGSNIGLR